MGRGGVRPFESDIWTPALEKYAQVTRLTVTLYNEEGQVACGPIHRTPLFDLIGTTDFGRAMFTDCVVRCLHRTTRSVTLVIRRVMAVIGTPLSLNDAIAGVAVAGYHLTEFPQAIAVERLARDAGLPVARVWEVVREERPIGRERFVEEGELLRAFGDTLLNETYRTRQHAELSAKLQAADAAKDQFLAMVSHELRGPLNAMLGWARLLRTEHLKGSARDHALETIERNAWMQTRLVEQLLDISRILAGRMAIERQPVRLGPVIESAIENVRPAADAKQIQLHRQLQNIPGSIAGDVNHLQQIVSNLLNNAVKFTPSGGTVSVELVQRGPDAELLVRDTGVGIKPEFLPQMFEPFRQQDMSSTRSHGGLGLGLAIARHLVVLHGGSIWAESSGVGQGATFVVRLPLVGEGAVGAWADEIAGHDRVSDAEPVPMLSRTHVLVVEDDPDALELLRTILERAGADVTGVTSARDALDAIDRAAPDVLVSDIGLPGQDGYGLIRTIRARDRAHGGEIPAVAVTAWAATADRDRTKDAGYDQHLAKPVDASELVAAVATLARTGRVRKSVH